MEWYLSGFRRYAEFVRGRARRTEFCTFMLTQLLLTGTLLVLGYLCLDDVLTKLLAIRDMFTVAPGLLLTLTVYLLGSSVLVVGFLATILPTLGVAARRLHDTGRSGWWLFSILIPGGVLLLLLFLLFEDSEPMANRFGLNPKIHAATAERRHVAAMRDDRDVVT